MAERVLMRGNEALGEAAIKSGMDFYGGYPITPSSEVMHYLSRRMPEEGRVFLQAESEVAGINLVYGASAAGARAMTVTSSCGFSLKQEGISYAAAAQLPMVVVNMQRGGPGVGSIQPGQADYLQTVKGGGNGDYRLLVFAPASVQEMVELTAKAFAKADEYRCPVCILGDGLLAQMMEPVDFDSVEWPAKVEKPWALAPNKTGRPKNRVAGGANEEKNKLLAEMRKKQIATEVAWEDYMMDDAEIVLSAYGTTARICKAAINAARKKGIKAGLIRPITVWPFPFEAYKKRFGQAKAFLVVEMSEGQMLEDVQWAVCDKAPVHFYGRSGGEIPEPAEVEAMIEKIVSGEVSA